MYNCSLEEINLNNCRLSDNHLIALSNQLQQHNMINLRILNLGGVQQFSEFIIGNHFLLSIMKVTSIEYLTLIVKNVSIPKTITIYM